MVLHRRVRMPDRYVAQGSVPSQSRRREEYIEVHHVVDDDRKLVRIGGVPAARAPDGATKAVREVFRKAVYRGDRGLVRRVSDNWFQQNGGREEYLNVQGELLDEGEAQEPHVVSDAVRCLERDERGAPRLSERAPVRVGGVDGGATQGLTRVELVQQCRKESRRPGVRGDVLPCACGVGLLGVGCGGVRADGGQGFGEEEGGVELGGDGLGEPADSEAGQDDGREKHRCPTVPRV